MGRNRYMLLFIITVLLTLFTVGCVGGSRAEPKSTVKYQMWLNTGSIFIYTFEDEETGVWYISSSKGVTPRLNPDGTLYTSK